MVAAAELTAENDRILDLGCGNGRLLLALPKKIIYQGVDFSSTLLAEAKKLHPKANFLEADITNKDTWRDLPKFDAIFCVAVLHHLESDKQRFLISYIRRRLKPAGFAYLSVWNLWQSQFLQNHLWSLPLKLHHWRYLEVPFMNQWQRFCVAFDKRYFERLLTTAGLKIKQLEYLKKNGQPGSWLDGANLVALVTR